MVCWDCGVGVEAAGGVGVYGVIDGPKGVCGLDRLGDGERGGNGSNSSGDKGLELTDELAAETAL